MRYRAYKKSITREILSSKARFASILVIILLGVAFYSGIKSSGPDMNKAVNELYKNQNLMDSKIVSTLGLSDKDLDLLKNNDKILDFYPTHTIDANLENINSVVRFMEYDKNNNINKFIVVDGRLPLNSGEIALDEQALKNNKNLKVGDTYTIESYKDTMKYFKKKTFKIVGFVKSPMYMEKESRGTTTVGKGSIDYFAVVNKDDISMDAYTEIYVRFKNVEGLDAYSDEYKETMEINNKYLESLYSDRKIDRVKEIKSTAQEELDKIYAEIEENENKLLSAKKEIESGKEKLKKGKNQYEQGLKSYGEEIKSGELSISNGKQELVKAQEALDKQKENLNIGKEKLKEAKTLLDNTKQALLAQGIDPDQDIGDIEDSTGDILPLINQYQQGKKQYEEQLESLNYGETQLQEGQKQLENAKLEIAKGEKELENEKIKGKLELDKAKNQLEVSQQNLDAGEVKIKENTKKILDAKEKIKKEQDKIDSIEGKYYFFNRTDNIGYSGLKDSINSLDSIASVFPLFFFLIAVLICLTTMTRMVEENRGEIGTLKALGYNNLEISRKFVIYASLASIIGSAIGILIGCNILPQIINTSYRSLYNLPSLIIYYYPSYVIQSIVISILCTVGAALYVLRVELKSTPSNLMRAKAPKIGKKILLERITPLWKRLNFNQKVTFRNIFRYKQRMIMTVFGIAGCMAMLVTGYGLQDSNNGMLQKQFNKLWKYEAMVIFNDNSSDKEKKEYNKTLKNLKGYEDNLSIHQETVLFGKKDINKQSATLYVPKDIDKINNFIILNDRKSEKEYKISDNGVIITEKLARLLGVSVGDIITLNNEENNPYKVKVDNICENYFAHYIYMSPSYYEKTFDKNPKYNMELLNFNSKKMDKEEISDKIMNCDNVINITLMSDIKKSTEESSANLDVIMLVIIIASGCLAFVVLYNLNNVNVSERIRELSTIKVLGFYDNEVTMYILRENIILTLLGILVGSFLGKLLHSFILYTSETDNMMMYPNISVKGYLLSALITIFFSMIVMIMMHIKLKKVDMIDALKSNE
ncbi:MAG TPA: FtsX-like permease family protein [Romboutsia timonensis]|uniref:FtsX-like permease family protein n=1 Tax=Romboutsia timonensis TaxID=1776391 RepID=A0A921MYG3_9FIRM|nr:FtsX-like permease family protein [uncultured Romboutsia sp.]HJG95598.1 FtsX-like permease family protein [Romboutsia timonensis]